MLLCSLQKRERTGGGGEGGGGGGEDPKKPLCFSSPIPPGYVLAGQTHPTKIKSAASVASIFLSFFLRHMCPLSASSSRLSPHSDQFTFLNSQKVNKQHVNQEIDWGMQGTLNCLLLLLFLFFLLLLVLLLLLLSSSCCRGPCCSSCTSPWGSASGAA